MKYRHSLLCAFVGLGAWLGCTPIVPTDTNDTGDTTTTGDNTTGDSSDTTDTQQSTRSVSGSIVAPANAKWAPRGQVTDEGFRVSVMSAETMHEYFGTSDADGNFDVDIPADEPGDLFMVTILDQQNRPLGPVLFDDPDANTGYTGLELSGDADLGTMALPDDPFATPINPSADADFGDSTVPDDVTVRLNDNGVPIGVPSLGKGDDADGDTTNNPRQQCDQDRDGLIDPYDADNDGNGIVDDFEPDGVGENPGESDGVTLNFFMNLKISDEGAEPFFDGDEEAIAESLKQLMVITFEVRGDGLPPGSITAARIIGPPAPTPPYLPDTTILGGGTHWSDDGFALQPDSGDNHFQQWVVPNEIMNTGDTFTVEITFADGTKGVYSRMINYVFKSIPKPVSMGDPNHPTEYTGPTEFNFNGNRDLVIEWNPPVDELGNLITGIPYFFEIFYYDNDNQQINDIDGAATWPTAPTGFDVNRTDFEVSGTELTTLSSTNSFTVRLPKEIFADTVETSGGPVTVSRYKIDIRREANGNNSAIMIPVTKAA